MKHKILIVDDEPNVRLFLQELLENETYIIKTAASGAEAGDVSGSFLPDIVFS